jgi:hypothetical protein
MYVAQSATDYIFTCIIVDLSNICIDSLIGPKPCTTHVESEGTWSTGLWWGKRLDIFPLEWKGPALICGTLQVKFMH